MPVSDHQVSGVKVIHIFFLIISIVTSCAANRSDPEPGVVAHTVGDDVPLAYFDNQPVKVSALPLADQLDIYDVESKRYDQLLQSTQAELIRRYIAREAERTKKDKKVIEKELLVPKPLTEAEIKKFYDQNKNKIPYPYELVKFEAKEQAEEEAKAKLRADLLNKIANESGTKFGLRPPIAPKISFDSKPFPALTEGNGGHELVQFLDYLCPHCKEAEPGVQELAKKYGKKLRIVAVDFPLHDSPFSIQIAKGSYCAMKKGKYKVFRDHAMGYFDGMKAFEVEFPKKIQIDEKYWKECLSSQEAKDHMKRAKELSTKLNIDATPTFFLDGRRIPADSLQREVEKVL